jgi:muramoyltetrapeptide carboxypeptidase
VVAVVAPAGPVPAERLEAGLTVLRSWGLTVVESAHVRARHAGLDYLTADDGTRAADLTAAWTDPAVRAVLCARGGYGVQRMVDLLDYDALADAGPKVLAGFSDITGLHQAFARRLGLATVHGPVVTSLGDADEDTREHLRRLLLEPEQATTLTPRSCPSWGSGRAEGVLVGGNLALLASDVGTPSSMSAARSLAVLEDVGESPYRLDRTLTHLLRSGWFDGVRGIVLGEFVRCGDPAAVRRVLEDRLAPLGVPVLLDVPIGHVAHNRAFALGVPAVLDADAGTLQLAAPPLR